MTSPRLARTAVALSLISIVLLAAPRAAGAMGLQEGDASPDAPIGQVFTISNTLVVLLLSGVLPLIIGILVKPTNPDWLKGLVAMLVTSVAHAISEAIQEDGTAALTQEWFVKLAITFLTTIGAYYGAWKPVVGNGDINSRLGPGVIPDPAPRP